MGHSIDQVEIPALEKDFALDVFKRIHVMEMKEAFRRATKGRRNMKSVNGQNDAVDS